jgi:hypothetical protein
MEFQDYNDYWSKYGQDFEKRAAWLSVAALFEEIGVLIDKKLADIDLVSDLFSTPVIAGWEKVRNVVKDERIHRKRPQIWQWFEYLYNEIREHEQRSIQQSTRLRSS